MDLVDRADAGSASTREECFPFARLPCDICTLVLREWVAHNILTLCDLDVAFCNRSLRPQYFQWIRGAKVGCQLSSSTNLESQLQWMSTRQLTFEFMAIESMDDDENILDLLIAHREVLSGTTDLYNYDRTGKNPASLIPHLPSLTKLQWAEDLSNPPQEYSWQYLPRLEQLKSLELTNLSPRPIFSRDFHLYLRFPNLTSLTMNINLMDICSVLWVCTDLPSLETLCLCVAPQVMSIHAVHMATVHSPALLPQIQTLALKYETSEEYNERCYDDVLSLLLKMCPQLTSLTVWNVAVTNQTLSKVLVTFLPQLQRLEWRDNTVGFLCKAEMRDSERYSQVAVDPVDCADADSVVNDNQLLRRLMRSLHGRSMKSLQLDLKSQGGTYPDALLREESFWTDLGQLSDLTALHFWDVEIPFDLSDEFMWTTILSLPNLEELRLIRCELLNPSLLAGLQCCADRGIVANKLNTFVVHRDGFMASDEEETAALHQLSALLPRVLTGLRILMLLPVKGFTSDMMRSLVMHLPCLRIFAVLDCAEEHSFIQTVTLEDWQSIARQSKCCKWDINLPLCAWPDVPRMIEGLGPGLQNLTLHVAEYQREHLERYCEETGRYPWYPHHRRCTVLFE